MIKLRVRQDGTGDFTTIGEALRAVPYALPACVEVGPGVYREKLFCEKHDLLLRGAGADVTRIVWGDAGRHSHPDGRPMHTFRSYTAFFGGERIQVEDMTIENDAGPGSRVGQAVAAYVDCRSAAFRRVRLTGRQDTLFCAPLPEREREKDGFLGPRMFAPRTASAQLYEDCTIEGDIDFIFGGAAALFERCTIRSVKNEEEPRPDGVQGYVAAPCEGPEAGFVFHDCDFVSDCPAGTVYLARPWRPAARMAVLNSRIGAHIAPQGFCAWDGRTDFDEARFAEYGNIGPGAGPRGGWAAALTQTEAEQTLRRARMLCIPVRES